MPDDNNNEGLHRAQKDVLVSNFAYEATRLNKKPLDDGLINVDELEKLQQNGIKFLGMSDFILEKDSSRLRAVIFVDEKSKQVTVGIAGTRIGHGIKPAIADLKDDAKLFFGFLPNKVKAAQKINELLIETLGAKDKNQIRDYEFHYTGHSLGAVVADCAAADMKLRTQYNHILDMKKNQISAVTFENPGSLRVVKKLCSQYAKNNPGQDIGVDSLKDSVSFKAINNRSNLINTLNPQIGERYVIAPQGQKPLNLLHLMCKYLSQALVVPLIRPILKMFSMGNIGKQLNEHKLEHFENVILENKGILTSKHKRKLTLDEVITGKEPLQFNDKIFNELKEIKSQPREKDVQSVYSMTNPESKERVEFSINQLTKASDNVNKNKTPGQKTPDQAPNQPEGPKPSFTEKVTQRTYDDILTASMRLSNSR